MLAPDLHALIFPKAWTAVTSWCLGVCKSRVGHCWQVLEFAIKKEMTLEMWTDRQDKIQAFFGPGVQANIKKTDQVPFH